MGSKSRRPQHGRPESISAGCLSLESVSDANVQSGEVSEGSTDENCLNIKLIQVDEDIRSETRVGENVLVRGFSVMLGRGRLGDIPHDSRDIVYSLSLESGKVLKLDIPTVRLCK